jgi:hypothetical protein
MSPRAPAASHITHHSDETIITKIMRSLTGDDLLMLGRVSRRLHELSERNTLWRKLCKQLNVTDKGACVLCSMLYSPYSV